MNRVYSFSVRHTDQASVKLLQELKVLCCKKGLKFSFIIIEALRLYKEQVLEHDK